MRQKAESPLSFYVRAGAEVFNRHPPGENRDGLLSTARTETLAGRVLGLYRVECEIGRGGAYGVETPLTDWTARRTAA